MRVYVGKVKDGCIDVEEPEGTQAVLIFDSVPSVARRICGGICKRKPKKDKPKTSEPGKKLRVRSRKGRRNDHIYRAVFGVSAQDAVKSICRESASRAEALAKVQAIFDSKGYGKLFRKRKIRCRLDGLVRHFSAKRRRLKPTGESVPKGSMAAFTGKCQSRLIRNPPAGGSRAMWKYVLGTSLNGFIKANINRSLDDNVADLIEALTKNGFEPDTVKLRKVVGVIRSKSKV